MGETEPGNDAGLWDDLSDALVALYLTEETGLPCNTKGYEITAFKATDSAGDRVEKQALRVTFEKNTSIKQQRHLLTFGSDDQRCNVILKATEASPVHCKVYAQLNSGPNVWVIQDTSTNGTEYVDEESLHTRISKTVVRGRVAAHGLYRIQIGRHVFGFSSPADEQEKSRRERWFQDLDSIPVTENLLREQLRGVTADYCPIRVVGQGGMGEAERVKNNETDERIQKEIGYMQSLKHPNLVQYIMSKSATKDGVKWWFTAMPLYQGRLCDILPLDISAIEQVMLQLFDAVHYMHGQRVLHKDIKPENILVKGKSRPDVVLANYGICASLNSRTELMSPSGTPGFAAPEVSRMIMQTQAVDVFALGATFFFIMEPERCKEPCATVATLENVMRRPPKVYGGLVQSMMAQDAKERPSLKECFDIVRARQRDWKKRTPLALPPLSILSASGLRRSQRIKKAMMQEPPIIDLAKSTARRPRLAPIVENGQSPIIDLARFTARKPRLALIAENRRLQEQQEPARLNFKAWDQVGRIPGPKVFNPPTPPKRELQKPAPVQQVDFSNPPPPTSANPFAHPDRYSPSNVLAWKAAPPMHEPAPTRIQKPDSDIKRRIRRGGERRKMIERWHKIRIQKNKLCYGAGELAALKPLNIARGLRELTEGGLGITGQYLGLIFADLTVAIPALRHIAPRSTRFGLNSNKRLMYGLKSQGLWPMTPEEYEAERLQSELNFPNTTEGKRVRARLEREAEYWRGEEKRAMAAERELEEREKPRMGRLSRCLPRGRY